jgi:hypothetical protein
MPTRITEDVNAAQDSTHPSNASNMKEKFYYSACVPGTDQHSSDTLAFIRKEGKEE